MKPTVAILSIGMIPVDEIRAVLTEHVTEEKITHISLLDNMSLEEINLEFAPDANEDQHVIMLDNNEQVYVGCDKVASAMQNLVNLLDKLGYEVILLMNTMPISGLSAKSAILLEPDRLIPPLVASIVEGHQMGVILPIPELIKHQRIKWHLLGNAPLYEVAAPGGDTDAELLDAGQRLIDRGATVIVLDYLAFLNKHQQLLQQQLDIPVFLSTMLIVRLASELLV
ncbi:AroM family protein [Citrobacter sp. JGM124]|uniref:AroM family protein n=1 Tax=Citrobacter sp. JGM124 TaxID=2799789 RepID=UPI001BAD55B2|nr:AroM family protein [Citrobacter sp. JGM124]MBS0848763.1 AroM family protein [Citrobacter sp. JGM124]